MAELSAGDRRILYLVARDADADGWATASALVWPLLLEIPDELLEKRPSGGAGHVRLTDDGRAVLKWS